MHPLLHRLRARVRARGEGPTRREVLERALAAGALLCASCAGTRRSQSSGPRVVVVGAGLAGLACAHELRARGAEVLVLEARARVGGRVHTLEDAAPGARVEAGGEFIGSNHPVWQRYAREFGLELDEVFEDPRLESPIVLQGERLSPGQVATLEGELDALQKALTQLAREVDGDAPWTHTFADALDMRHVSGWVEEQQVSRLARHAFRVLLAMEMGMPTARQSLLGMLAQVAGGGHEAYWTESESWRCAGGNARLARALAGAIGPERVLQGTPVQRVAWTERHATVVSHERTFEADRVVIAVPPTVLGRIAFEPALPPGLAPQMGRSVKYLTTLARRVWAEQGLSSSALTDGPVSTTWDALGGQAVEQAVLTAFSSGEAADHCRALRGAAQRAMYEAELEALFPGLAAAFVGARFLDWPGEEWTRGGYSFPAPGEVTTRLRRLRQPLGPIAFAGEHTSTRFPGYMEGALESGVRVANAVLAAA